MEKKSLNVIEVVKGGCEIGVKNAASLVGALFLWIITIWIPYLNVGTTIAINTIPLELSKGKVISPFFIFDGKLIGIIAVADTIKDDSRESIKELKALNITPYMITGDNQLTAKAIATEAEIENVIAGVMPNEKSQAVNDLKKNGKIAMVGDGINDAPALTSADVGIAIGSGSDIAIDSADIVITKNTLMDVVTAIRLSRATLNTIKGNLFWAFIYNIIGIPLAAGVFIPLLGWELNPMFGALAMSLSSFFVVMNALRLNLFKRGKK